MSTQSRRRSRDEVVEEIKAAARDQMEHHGMAAFSLRGVARQVGIVPSGIYRYFPSQQALLSALAQDASADLAEALEAWRDSVTVTDPGSRWFSLCGAYRTWALGNRASFALLFGDPGLVPADGVAWAAAPSFARLMQVPMAEFADAVAAGAIDLPAGPDERPAALLGPTLMERRLTPSGQAAVVSAWTSLSGFVGMDLFGQLSGIVADRGRLFDFHVRAVMRSMGFREPSHVI